MIKIFLFLVWGYNARLAFRTYACKRIIFMKKENCLYRVLGESISSGGAPNISCALALDLTESSRFLKTEIFLVQII